MPLYGCNLSVDNLPDSITFKGNLSIYWDSTGGAGTGNSSTTTTIPTMGYKKADITATKSNVGTGNNIDISSIQSIQIEQQNNIIKSDIKYNPNGFYYTTHGSTYSVTLHN